MQWNWITSILGEEWFAGFISGVAATIFGFLLTIIWDIDKARRDIEDWDEAVLRAIKEELISNKTHLENNIDLIQTELSVLDKKGTVIQPLVLLKTGFWDLAKINFPKKLRKGNTLSTLRNLVVFAEQANEEIKTRENHRIHNGAMTNYLSRLEKYDTLLLKVLTSFSNELEKFYSEMNTKSPGVFAKFRKRFVIKKTKK